MRASRLVLLTFLFGAFLATTPLWAKGREWFKYENSYFVAYSDAKKKRVLELLLDLERFRASTVQVASIQVPLTAPKVQVLILHGKGQFTEVAPSKNAGGFFITPDDLTALIVLPSSGNTDWNKTVIRHEYAHALLRHNDFAYPSWYEEGFAELMSATEIVDNGKSFFIGRPPERAVQLYRPIFPWPDLISDQFEPHRIQGAEKASSAYAQAWLLAHYTTLGGNLQNSKKLQRYFSALKAGENSEAAFQVSFGVAVKDIWKQRLRSYSREFSTYKLDFKSELVDSDFQRTSVDWAVVEPTVIFLRRNTLANWRGKAPRNPLSRLSGSWDVNSIAQHCDDPIRFQLSPNKDQIVLAHVPGLPPDSGSVTLDLEEIVNGDYMLFPTDGYVVEPDGDPFYINFRLRGDDVACWRQSNWITSDCGAVMVRCSD